MRMYGLLVLLALLTPLCACPSLGDDTGAIANIEELSRPDLERLSERWGVRFAAAATIGIETELWTADDIELVSLYLDGLANAGVVGSASAAFGGEVWSQSVVALVALEFDSMLEKGHGFNADGTLGYNAAVLVGHVAKSLKVAADAARATDG